MKCTMLGLCLASLLMASGCCCWKGSGWSPYSWKGWQQGCVACGGCCGESWYGGGAGGWGGLFGCGGCGGCGSGCGNPGGCGSIYWGDFCAGSGHCSTCDGCGNWVGPPSPGGNGTPPEVYSKMSPYGHRVAQSGPGPMKQGPQMARNVQGPLRQSPQMVRNRVPPQYNPPVVRRQNPYNYGGRNAPQMVRRGPAQEYEGAVQYLGTTDRLVSPARLPNSEPATMAQRGQPTLAEQPAVYDEEGGEEVARPQVRRTSQRTYAR